MNPIKKYCQPLHIKLFFCTFGSIVLLIFAGKLVYETTKAEVTVFHEGEAVVVETHKDTVGDILEDLEINVGEHDQVSHENTYPLHTGIEIHINKAKQVNVEINDKKIAYYTTAGTIGEFLEENGISVKKHDYFSHSAEEIVTDNLKVKIKRAFPVTIQDAAEKNTVWTTGESVSSLLARQGIELAEEDEVSPAETKQVGENTIISITRVKIITEVQREEKNYATIIKEDATLEKGTERIIVQGENGVVAKHFQVRTENGKETDRKLVKEEIEKASKQKIVALGTKEDAPVPKTVAVRKTDTVEIKASNAVTDSNQQEEQIQEQPDGKSFSMHATAYSAECQGCSGKTATGIDLKSNPEMKVIAVDPSVIPLGTEVWVEGYGTAIAGDTGGAIHGNKIDVHMPSREAALEFGSRQVEVKILD